MEKDESEDCNTALKCRTYNKSYLGSKVFEEFQWGNTYAERKGTIIPPTPVIRDPATEKVILTKDDPNVEYDLYRESNSEFIFDNFGAKFPSFDEMKTFVSLPDETAVQAQITRIKEEHIRHLKLLQDRHTAEMDRIHTEVFRSTLQHEGILENKYIAEDILCYAEADFEYRHADLLERVNYAHHKALLDQIDDLLEVIRRRQETFPEEERFPLSIEEFRDLKRYTKSQVRVARYLVADEEETRRQLFDSKWQLQDTQFLQNTVKHDPSFKEELVQIIRNTPVPMDVDADPPALSEN